MGHPGRTVKSIVNSCCSAFLMYSRIPMPQVEWKEENRRYALCFFPAVGVVIGLLLWFWGIAANRLGVSDLLFASVSAVIPLLVTGGIHMDGFCDVTDARSSWADRKRKLEIMSDPHVGSFAVIAACAYLLLQTGLFTGCRQRGILAAAALSYPLSRVLSGLAAVTFRNAKKEGTLQDFAVPADRRTTIAALCIEGILCAAGLLKAAGAAGAAQLLAAVLVFLWYRRMAYRIFGGITGDLAGWFLQVCELVQLAAAILVPALLRS